MMSPIERHRLREGLIRIRGYSTHEWRQYFSYLLGRAVTLEETDQFLREEFEQQSGAVSRETAVAIA